MYIAGEAIPETYIVRGGKFMWVLGSGLRNYEVSDGFGRRMYTMLFLILQRYMTDYPSMRRYSNVRNSLL